MGIFCHPFIYKCFKVVINKLVIKRPQVATVERKSLIPYLRDISFQTRTKLKKSFKCILNCCKLQIVFKTQKKLANVFRFIDRLPFNLVSGVIYEYLCEGAILPVTVRRIDTWKLGLENISGYHHWHMEKLSH